MAVRVLIADNDSIFRKTVREVLSFDSDIRIIGEAIDGEQAISKTAGLHPDVVLMDISMPKIDGLAATSYIKKYYPSIGVLIVTIHEGEEYQKKAMKVGADNFLIKKNLSPRPLLKMIEAAYHREV